MDDKLEIKRDSKGYWQPVDKINYQPVFFWPPNFKKLFKFFFNFPGFFWPWNTFYMVLTLITWFYFMPELSKCNEFKFDWIFQIFLRNLVILWIIAGGTHLRYFILKSQGNKFQYNSNPLDTFSKKWIFSNQTQDNIFWSCLSGCTIWTAYEVIFMWGYANNLFPYIDFNSNPIWFLVWFILVLFWREFHFYITHRILHFQPLFKYVHYLHHKNINIGPWSGLSMHPIEHIIYFSVVLIHIFIPSHPIHFIFNLQHTALSPLQGHSGFDQMIIKGNAKIPHSSFFHYLHHRYFECNYGESTIPLDKWFGSFHDGSKKSFNKLFRKN